MPRRNIVSEMLEAAFGDGVRAMLRNEGRQPVPQPRPVRFEFQTSLNPNAVQTEHEYARIGGPLAGTRITLRSLQGREFRENIENANRELEEHVYRVDHNHFRLIWQDPRQGREPRRSRRSSPTEILWGRGDGEYLEIDNTDRKKKPKKANIILIGGPRAGDTIEDVGSRTKKLTVGFQDNGFSKKKKHVYIIDWDSQTATWYRGGSEDE